MLTLFESVLMLPNAHRFSFECLAKTGGGRGTPGSRDLLVGAGPDHMAREVEAALAWLQHQGEQGQRLAKLASLRYLPERELSVAEQMRLLGLEPSADRTYRNWAQRLHDRMIAELSRRSERRGT